MARVLIADDSRPIRLLIRRALSLGGHEILEAENGDEALDRVKRERPDVAILDVIMPGRSGIDVCRAVRADPLLAATGVIFLTGDVTSEHLRQAGADVIFAKPFSPHALLTAVASLTPRTKLDKPAAADERPRILVEASQRRRRSQTLVFPLRYPP